MRRVIGESEAAALRRRFNMRAHDAVRRLIQNHLRYGHRGTQRRGPICRRIIKETQRFLKPFIADEFKRKDGYHYFLVASVNEFGQLSPKLIGYHPKRGKATWESNIFLSAHAFERYIQHARIRHFSTMPDELADLMNCMIQVDTSDGVPERLLIGSDNGLEGHLVMKQDGDRYVAVTFIGVRSYSPQKRVVLEDKFSSHQLETLQATT